MEAIARYGSHFDENNMLISKSIFRIMQDKDDKQRKGENIVDISSKKKKRGCC